MYIPPAFKVDDREKISELILDVKVGELITFTGGELVASVVPFLYEPRVGAFGRLRGHIARANSHWRAVDSDVESLVLFRGANAYVSPSWYPSKALDEKVVPTWNYVAVEARGRLLVHDDRDWKLEMVSDLTERYESTREEPWSVERTPIDYLETQLKAIVGIELDLSSIVGKFKLSQNRSYPDFAGAISGLERDGELEVSSKMRDLNRTP